MSQTYEREIGRRPLSIEAGRMAGQANGAVTVRHGDTVILVTACVSEQPREGIDFFPLTVDYEERLYAAGKIPGSFFRREGRPSTEATLAARLTDRPLRPLFPKGFRNDVQIVVTVLSADQENDPDVLATIGASTALGISDIPFGGPVSSVRVGHIDDRFVVNPTFSELHESTLDLVVSSTRDAMMMVEAGANQVSEELILQALEVGQQANQEILDLEEEVIREYARPKLQAEPLEVSPEVRQEVASFLQSKLGEILEAHAKEDREAGIADRRQELMERLGETYSAEQILAAFDDELKREVRSSILERGVRADGRDLTTVRPISCEVSVLPRTHGSGLFTRGETQVLTIATLGSVGQEQRLDTLSPEESKRFLHHYNFPPFSVGEVRRIGTPPRRAVGHGALAERAMDFVIPSEEEFPYTIRLVSEVLSSNGSTSMGAVCGSTLSLMDAGVPIKAPVAGIAMGLVMGDDGKYAVLTDIIGMEDALGDMDFKVAGTRDGITALQMDIKVKGITVDIIRDALAQGREARLFVLERMLETIPEARSELSRWAPRMYRLQISPEKIGTVIGPGGRVIRSIIEETKCTIDVEDDGAVFIGSTSEEAARKAVEIIEGLTKDVEVGEIYTGKVTRLMNFGAFVEVMPGKEGLIHISELADYHVPSVEDVVQVGDEVMVKVTEIDSLGRINLSRKAVLEQDSQPGTAGPPQRAERPPARNRFSREPQPRRGDGRRGSGGPPGGDDRNRRHRRPRRRGGGGGGGSGAGPQRGESGPPPPPPPPRPNLGGRY